MRKELALLTKIALASMICADLGVSQDALSDIRKYSLQHPKPEARTRWEIPDVYLSRQPFHRAEAAKSDRSLIAIEVALPEMVPWSTSGLSRPRDDKLFVEITMTASFDFGIEKRILPRLLRERVELIGPYDRDLLLYRRFRPTLPSTDDSPYLFLVPSKQPPGKAIYFECVRVCIATTDFAEAVHLKYTFDRSLIGDWTAIDQKIRELLVRFYKA